MRLRLLILKAVGKLSTMNNTPVRFRLLDLPNELVVHIIEHVSSQSTLGQLSRVCKRIQQLTEPILYRYAMMRTGRDQAKMLDSLQQRTARAKALHYLDIPCHPLYVQSFDIISDILSRSLNLRELMIESPECNTTDFEDGEAWENMAGSLLVPFQHAVLPGSGLDRPLQRLQKLVLHLNGIGSPYWTIDSRSISLFLLPSLQYLKLSCVNILDKTLKHIDRHSCTALRHLDLEESNVTHRGLHAILALPRALEVLSLGVYADPLPVIIANR
jgi:hypothetical protein